MKNALTLALTAIACLCVGTVLAQLGLVAVLALKGHLSRERVYKCLAVLHNLETSAKPENAPPESADTTFVAYQQVLEGRALKTLDVDLRQTAIEKDLAELRVLQTQIKGERERYDLLKKSFESRLAEIERHAANNSLLEVQRTLETIMPRQAKDQLLRMLSVETQGNRGQALTDVVTIIKAMPLDKRAKIIAEFRSPEESEQLHEILERIRRGEPENSVIRATRDELKGI